jgi:hypothetical protein
VDACVEIKTSHIFSDYRRVVLRKLTKKWTSLSLSGLKGILL